MPFKKLRSSVIDLFKKEEDSPADFQQKRKNTRKAVNRSQKKKVAAVLEFFFGHEDASAISQIKMLVDQVRDKGRSLTEQIHLLTIEKEMTENLLKCTICYCAYSKNRVPQIGSCGHTICHRCVKSIRGYDCPICRYPYSFVQASKNFLVYNFATQMSTILTREEKDEVEEDEVQMDKYILIDEWNRHSSQEFEEDEEEVEAEYDDLDEEEQSPPSVYDDGTENVKSIRRELNELFEEVHHDEEEFFTRASARYDYVWFLIFSYSLYGGRLQLQRLRRMLFDGTPFYYQLRNAAYTLQQWKLQQGGDRRDPALVMSDLINEWKDDVLEWQCEQEDLGIDGPYRAPGAIQNGAYRLSSICALSVPFRPIYSLKASQAERRTLFGIRVLHLHRDQLNNEEAAETVSLRSWFLGSD